MNHQPVNEWIHCTTEFSNSNVHPSTHHLSVTSSQFQHLIRPYVHSFVNESIPSVPLSSLDIVLCDFCIYSLKILLKFVINTKSRHRLMWLRHSDKLCIFIIVLYIIRMLYMDPYSPLYLYPFIQDKYMQNTKICSVFIFLLSGEE